MSASLVKTRDKQKGLALSEILAESKGFSILIIIAVIGLILGAGGFFFLSKQTTKSSAQPVENTSKETVTEKVNPESDEIYFESSDKKLLLTGGFMENVKPMGSKPPPPPECVGKKADDPNLSQSCQMWFNIK